jgi:hypothetical protein
MTGDIIWLDGAGIRAGIAPRLGGRMLSLRFGDTELLWRNPALLDEALAAISPPVELGADATFSDWQNWGGDKTWPAPQGWDGDDRWAGPPDGVLDAGGYNVVEHRPGRSVVLESAADPKSGLSITRSISVDASRPCVRVSSTLTNTSPVAVTWAAWEVAQFAFSPSEIGDTVAGVYVEHATPSREASAIDLFSPVGTIEVIGAMPTVARVPFAVAVGKLGFPAATGRIALVRGDGLSVQCEFRVHGGVDYPDNSPFQLWMQVPVSQDLAELPGLRPDAFLVEIEPLSPLTHLAPSETVELVVEWICGRSVPWLGDYPNSES